MDFDNLERLRRARAPKAPKMMAQPLGRLHVVETPAAIAPPERRDRVLTVASAVLAFLVAGVVILAQLYHGGNRPIVWGGVALVLGVGLAGWQGVILLRGGRGSLHFASMGAGPWLALVVPVFAAIQMLPIGGIEAGLPSGFATASISLSPDATSLGLVRIFSAVLVFFSFAIVAANPPLARRLGWALFGAALLQAGLAMGEAGVGAARGGFANHNSFAAFTGMGLILGLSLMLGPPSKAGRGQFALALERALLWLALLFVLVALVASQSRLGVLSAAVGAGVALVVLRPTHGRTFLFGAVAIAAALAVAGEGLVERASLLGPDAGIRMELYRQVLGMIADRPLTGWGLDCFPLAFELAHSPSVSSGLVWDHAHNSYLTLWSEMGLIAGSAPMLGLFLIALRLWTTVRRSAPRPRPLAAAALGLIAAEAVHGLGDFSLEITGNLYLSLATPLYTSEALILVDPSPKNLLNPEDSRSLTGTSENARLESEVQILRSDAVAVATMEAMGLMNDPEYGPRLGLVSRLRLAVGLGYGAPPEGEALFQATLARLKSATTVRRRDLTFVVSVGVTSESPARAAALANALARTYIERQVAGKIETALATRDLMRGQLAEAQTRLTASEAALSGYVDRNLDRLETESESPRLGELRPRLDATNADLAQEDSLRARVDAALGLSDWQGMVTALGDEGLGTLESQRADLERRLGGAGGSSAEAVDLQARLDDLEAEIEARGRAALAAANDRIGGLSETKDDLREEVRQVLLAGPVSAQTLSDLYGLQREATLAQDYYDTLLRRIHDAEAQAFLQVADSRLVSEALPPAGPSYPDRKMALVLALVAALGLGVGIAVLNEFYVGGVASASQLANLVPAPVATTVPKVTEAPGTPTIADRIVDEPLSLYSESFRLLRAAIDRTVPPVPGDGRIIMITSAMAAEGKSTNALALARTYALAGKRTLLIDADLRRPSQHVLLGLDPSAGLLDYLRSPAEFEITGEFYDADPRSPLGIIMGNRRSDIPTDQPLMSETFARLLRDARKVLDVIVIDTAPLLPIVDPRYIAPHVDLAVLSVQASATSQSDLRAAYEQLEGAMAQAGRIVTLLNSVGTDGLRDHYDGYYGAHAS
jgi:succinoglycan biosynthesis transport protein ExoP